MAQLTRTVVSLVAALLLLQCTANCLGAKQRWLLSSASKASNNTLRYTKPYNICTSDWAPMVMCSSDAEPSTYTGFQIELWREIARDLGWAEGDWTFSCIDWTAMIDDMVDPDGLCSFAAAGVEVSMPNILAGLKFSWPIYKSGFRILIASLVEEGGTWAFAGAFHWSVWVVLGATAILSSLLISGVELVTFKNKANKKGLRGWSWYCMGMMVTVPVHVGDPKTWAGRVLVLGYAFLVLIVVHLFTATTANKMTMQRLANDITSKADLPGKEVESWEPYVPLLRKYSIDAAPMAWDNDEDTAVMLANLRSAKYRALILDAPVVQFYAAQAETCDLWPIGDAFETFNLAIAFPPDVPDELPANVSASIVRLQTKNAILDVYENLHIKNIQKPDGSSGCANAYQDADSHSTSQDPQITMDQVAGLWYILLITLGLAFLVSLTQNIRYYKEIKQKVVCSFSGSKRDNQDIREPDACPEQDCVAVLNTMSLGKDGKGQQQLTRVEKLPELAPVTLRNAAAQLRGSAALNGERTNNMEPPASMMPGHTDNTT